MADGRPPGTGPESVTPPGGRPPTSLNPERRPLTSFLPHSLETVSPERRNPIFTDRHGRTYEIPPMRGGEVAEPPAPETPGGQVVNLSQESINAIKEPMERIAEAMGAVRRERGEQEQTITEAGETAETRPVRRRGATTSRDRLLRLDQDWMSTYVEFSHYRTLMMNARERGDTEEEHYLQQKIWDRVNGNLSVLDTDEAGEAPGIQEILQSVNILFSVPEFEFFRQEISNWVEGRLITHNVAFAGKYLGAEDWQKAVTNLRGRHFESLLTGSQATGVKEAAAILEAPDEHGAKGVWYRNRAASKEEVDSFEEFIQKNHAILDKVGNDKKRVWDLIQKI